MEEFRFGAQSQAPRCWGKSYTEGDRECRACGFQESCKGEIVRNAVNRPAMYNTPAVPPPFQPYPFQQPQVPQVQVPAYQPPQRPQRFFTGQPMPSQSFMVPQQYQQPIQQAVQQPQYQQPPSQQYGYGWMQDPMHHYVHSVPPPFRPQMVGESFGERMVKNIGLAMLESLFANMFLSVRQMMWGPESRIIDVVPLPPQPPQK